MKKFLFITTLVVMAIVAISYYLLTQKSPSNQAPNAQNSTSTPHEESYALLQMTSGDVINITSDNKGAEVKLLKNPEIKQVEGTTIPFMPKNPVWANVPDGTYITLAGQRYIIKDSKIFGIIDRNGNQIVK